MNNLLFDYDHPTLRVAFVSTVIVLGLLIINDLIPWGAFGRRTRRRESNVVLIILAILLSPPESGVTVSFQDFIGGRGWEKVIIICERAFRLPRPKKKIKMYGVTVGVK